MLYIFVFLYMFLSFVLGYSYFTWKQFDPFKACFKNYAGLVKFRTDIHSLLLTHCISEYITLCSMYCKVFSFWLVWSPAISGSIQALKIVPSAPFECLSLNMVVF